MDSGQQKQLKKLHEDIRKRVDDLNKERTVAPRYVFNAPKDWATTILIERQDQRRKVFNFSIGASNASLSFLVGIIALQAIYRIINNNSNFSFFSGAELEVLSVGVFGQVIGLMYIIAKKLWDDSIYKDHLDKKVPRNKGLE